MLTWKDLSISKKLYGLVGLMVFLVAFELLTLLFAVDTLSAARAFISREARWTISEKLSIRNLQAYALTKDSSYYDNYLKYIQVPYNDLLVRIELEKENFDPKIVEEGMIRGKIDKDDIQRMIKVFRYIQFFPQFDKALKLWPEADHVVRELMDTAEQMHEKIQANADPESITADLAKIYTLDTVLTDYEDRFTSTLGEISRWLEKTIMLILTSMIILVGGSGLFFAIKFSRYLSSSLNELNAVTQHIGQKNFNKKATNESKDELGQLATSINKMADDLKKSLGQRDKAENESQFKTMFLANMSHEIRTPIGIILGFSDLLKDPSLSIEDREHFLNTIQRTGNNLLRIINDILDISRVESGHIDIHPNKFKLALFIENLSTLLEVKAAESKNRLGFKPKGKIPSEISTDETRLHQILLNLINNALKFTEDGLIEVCYWVESNHIYFEVTDSGSGMDAEGSKKLFKLFSQVDSELTRKHGGSGLGLVLSKGLAKLLGGDVVLKSSHPGIGSTFLAHVQLQETQIESPIASTKVIQASELEFIKGKNILIVDDSEDNQLLLKVLFQKIQVKTIFANNGNEGVSKALTENPDIILMDIQMPVKDGYAATTELRQKGWTKPIIALTANAMIEDRKRCLQSGCNDYLTKPIEINKLHSLLIKYLKT